MRILFEKHCGMKSFALLVILVLALLLAGAAAEDAPAAYYSKTSLGIPAYGCGTVEVPVLVSTDDPARANMTEEEVAGEIRFFPYDAVAGTYASGDGEPAGEKAKLLNVSEDRTIYTVRLKEPGKYLLSGTEFYLLDLKEPALSALRAELDGALEKNRDKQEKKTAQKLHDWLCGRVKSVIPEDAEALVTACGDPMNALLTGYADRKAYARLYSILLEAAGIRSVIVSGTAGEEEAEWNLSSLDGSWLWTDAAMDDAKDKKQNKYLAKDDKAFAKDHTLSAADQAFLDGMIRTTAFDQLLANALPFRFITPEGQDWDEMYFDFIWYDGPAFVVGDSATVTWHRATNDQSLSGFATPEDYCLAQFTYAPWVEEELYYYDSGIIGWRNIKIPSKEELMTIDEASENAADFTVTFRVPGCYRFYNGMPAFYLISPEQKELVALAEEIAAAAEKDKSATEKETAQKLMKWMNGRLKYNYTAYNMMDEFSDRDMGTCEEGMGGLLYGKAVCGGYADAYDIMLRQAGLMDFGLSGIANKTGHSWNLNRLDGEWSYSDATWADAKGGYFALAPEKMNRDHEPYQNGILNRLFFNNPYSFQRDQFSMKTKAAIQLPRALKFLPATAEGYGFPAKLPQFIQVKELAQGEGGLTLTLEKTAAAVHMAQLDNGREMTLYAFNSSKAGDRFTSQYLTLEEPLRVEIRTYETADSLKKPAVQEILDYENGEETAASYRYLVPMKKNEVDGYSEKSYRIYGYDAEMRPALTGWYLAGDKDTVTVFVYFDAEGKADHYTVEYKQQGNRETKTSWTATADGTLTELNGKAVENPEEVEISAWVQLFFE